MKRIMRKLKCGAGFTLAETLLAVLILLLVTGLVAGGMPAAVSAYRNAIDAANAHVLLSTAVTALRNELTTARDVVVDEDGTAITYTSGSTGSQSKIYFNDSRVLFLQEYNDRGSVYGTTLTNKPDARALVPEATTKTTKDGSKMTVTAEAESTGKIFALSKDSKDYVILTVSGLKVKRGATTIAQLPNLTIRVLTGGGA